MLDDQLCEAFGIAVEEPETFWLVNPGQRHAFVTAIAAEVVPRLDGRKAA